MTIPLGAPSTFEIPVGAARSVSFAKLSLRDVRSLKDQFGVTINDVVLAICSGALRSHLAEHEEEVDESLVAVVPISVRSELATKESWRTGSWPTRTWATGSRPCSSRWPTISRSRWTVCGPLPPPARQRRHRSGPSATGLWLPPCPRPCRRSLARPMIQLGIQVGALRRLRTGNLMISNVPGPNFSLYFAGMRMMAAYPLGPVVDGVALNITVQTYDNSMFIGINASANAVPDVDDLARSMVAELDRLTEAADREYAADGPGRVRGRPPFDHVTSPATGQAVPGRRAAGRGELTLSRLAVSRCSDWLS